MFMVVMDSGCDRYFGDLGAEFEAGVVSGALREALGMQEVDLPPWYARYSLLFPLLFPLLFVFLFPILFYPTLTSLLLLEWR